ncbi:MAG: mechanosensitive ion channel family protein [Planctomycetota bacterium]|nr:mechanosensitive ion channel family protein [Planctomycetota bacterium]
MNWHTMIGAAGLASAGNPSVVENTLRSLGVETYWDRLAPVVTQYGVRVVGACLFLFVALYFSGVAGRGVRRALERSKIEVTLARFLGNVSRVLILVLAVLTCMGMVGIPITSFAALLGAGGLATGLALQGSLSNVAAGAALSITRPFKVGDFVSIASQMGIVDEIGLFSTALNTPDNRRIIIPNGQIFGTVIENMTHNPVRRAEVLVGVSYGADMHETREVLARAAGEVMDRVADPPPLIMVDSFGDSSVIWRVCVWAPKEKFLDARQQLFFAVRRGLDSAGIEIPFPQRVVRVVKDGEAARPMADGRALPRMGNHAGGADVLADEMSASGEPSA